jgi:plastocyanin
MQPNSTQFVADAELGLVQAGEAGSVTATFNEPGEYQYFCTVSGHFVAGMQGTITVDGYG